MDKNKFKWNPIFKNEDIENLSIKHLISEGFLLVDKRETGFVIVNSSIDEFDTDSFCRLGELCTINDNIKFLTQYYRE